MCSLENAPEEGWAAERALAFEQKHGASADARFSPLRAVAESSRRLTEEAGPKMDEKEVQEDLELYPFKVIGDKEGRPQI